MVCQPAGAAANGNCAGCHYGSANHYGDGHDCQHAAPDRHTIANGYRHWHSTPDGHGQADRYAYPNCHGYQRLPLVELHLAGSTRLSEGKVEPLQLDYGHCAGDVGSDFDEPQPSDPFERLWMSADDQIAFDGLVIPQMWRPFKAGATITQGYGVNGHKGVDFGLRTGTPIYACHAGQVVIARQDYTGYGWVVAIKNDTLGVYTVYGHLNYAAGIVVRVGQQVAEREHIGYSDNTGNSTGPHLHLELRVPPYGYPGACINPLPYLRVWDDEPAPQPPPTPPPAPSGSRARTLKKAPIIKKNTGKQVGVYPAGVTLIVGGVDGKWTYVPGQLGQRDGWVNSKNLVRV